MNQCKNFRTSPCIFDCPNCGEPCPCMACYGDDNEGVIDYFFSKENKATYIRSIQMLLGDVMESVC